MITAFVTGASRGIGAQIARLLAQHKVRVIAHGRSPSSALTTLVNSLEHASLEHCAVTADLTDLSAIDGLCQALYAQAQQIDVLVNNAGIYRLHDLASTSIQEWDQAFLDTVNANLLAPALLTQRLMREMATNELIEPFGRGRVVNITSRGAFRGEPQAPAYGAAKAGLNAFGQSLAQAGAPSNIYTYTIAPGWVATDMAGPHLTGPMGDSIRAQHPLGRVATVEELAQLTVFCALTAPATMTGCIIDINGASYLRT